MQMNLPVVMGLLFLGATGISALITPLSIKLAPKIGAVDAPKARGMHTKVMPRFGGMGIFAASMAMILLFLPLKVPEYVGATIISPEPGLVGVLLAGAWMYFVGVIDDIKGLPAKVKLAGQILAALILYFYSVRFDGITNPFSGQELVLPAGLSLVLTVVWVVGITNTINLIDGLDGLAGGISVIAAMCAAYTAYVHGWYLVPMVLVVLAGSSVGFLFYNFHPAKTFMGDSGALFLGFMLAAVSMLNPVKTTALTSTIVPIIILALPIFDTVFAILRRLANGRPIMEADKGHLHHRIMTIGMGQRRTVLTLYAISLVLGVCGVLISRGLWKDSLPLLLAAGMLIYVFMKKDPDENREVVHVVSGEEKNRKEEETNDPGNAGGGKQMKKVMAVFGTRPEAIKMAPLVLALKKEPSIQCILCVTAQHREMLDQVLDLFELTPDYDLNIMKPNQTIGMITSNVILGLEKVLEEEKPDIVLVHGDTTTTFATALTCFYHRIAVGHVEAGLRTYNKYSPFPEEINRVLTGHIADIHFAPTERNRQNLLREGVPDERIVITGNTVIDALLTVAEKPYEFEDETLKSIDFAKRRVITVTCHRRENLGENMEHIFSAIRDIAAEFEDVEIVYPVHLNPKVREIADRILRNGKRVHLIEPLTYQPFVNLMAKSYLIVTDSGGMQEEAPSLGKPVLVVRKETERPEALEAGTVRLAGVERDTIYGMMKTLLTDKKEYDKMAHSANPYGDGTACDRIVKQLK